MMSNQFQQAFTTTDGQNNITYVHFVHPQQNVLFCKDDVEEEEADYYAEEATMDEETIEESYIEEDPVGETVEILESVVVERKKKTSEPRVTKKLVQVKGNSSRCSRSYADQFLLDSDKPKGRRRVIPDQTRAIRKIRANTNKAYVNAKGVEVRPKEFDATFICTCPKKCTEPNKLPLKTRRQIFNMFWNIGSYEGRCAFLNSCVNEQPKRRTYTKSDCSRRKMTRKYYLKGVEVCKTTFTKVRGTNDCDYWY